MRQARLIQSLVFAGLVSTESWIMERRPATANPAGIGKAAAMLARKTFRIVGLPPVLK